MNVYTQVQGEDQGWTGVHVEPFQKMNYLALDLDSGLVENTDWFHVYSGTSVADMDNTFANNVGASLTWTPDGTSDYLVLASFRMQSNADTTFGAVRLRDTTDAATRAQSGLESNHAAAVLQNCILPYIYAAPANSPRTVRLEGIGENIWDMVSSEIFILRLNAFESYAYHQSSPGTTGHNVSYASVGSFNIDCDDRDLLHYFGYSQWDPTGDSDGVSSKLEIGGVEVYNGNQSGGDDYAGQIDGTQSGETAKVNYFLHDFASGANVSGGSKLVDMKMKTNNASMELEQVCMFAFGTRLAQDPARIRVMHAINDVRDTNGSGYTDLYREDGGTIFPNSGAGPVDQNRMIDLRHFTNKQHVFIDHAIVTCDSGGSTGRSVFLDHYTGDFNSGVGGMTNNFNHRSRTRVTTGFTPIQQTGLTSKVPTDEHWIYQIGSFSQNNPTQHGVGNCGIFSIELSELTQIPNSVTASGDWDMAFDAVNMNNMDNTYGNNIGASLSFTPINGDSYMILAYVRVFAAGAAGGGSRFQCRTRLREKAPGTATRIEMSRNEPDLVQPTEAVMPMLYAFTAASGAQHQFDVEFQGDNHWFHERSGIFVLRLNAFKSWAFSHTTLNSFYTNSVDNVVNTLPYVPNGAEEAVALNYMTCESVDEAADQWRFHLDYDSIRHINNRARKAAPVVGGFDRGGGSVDQWDNSRPLREPILNVCKLGTKADLVNANLESVFYPTTANNFARDFTSVIFSTELDVQPPGDAVTPSPADGNTTDPTGVQLDDDLSWGAPVTGGPPTAYDVYFGTSEANVIAGTGGTLVSSDQVGLTYDPGTMLVDTTYYWRIGYEHNRAYLGF
jgi:hypothetical protein